MKLYIPGKADVREPLCRHWWRGSLELQNEHSYCTTKIYPEIPTDQQKINGISQRTAITPVLTKVGQNFLLYFARYLKFFAEFQLFIYLFIYSTTSRGTPNDVLCNARVSVNPGWEVLIQWLILCYIPMNLLAPMHIPTSRGRNIIHAESFDCLSGMTSLNKILVS